MYLTKNTPRGNLIGISKAFIILRPLSVFKTLAFWKQVVALERGMFSFMKGYGAVTGVDIDKSPVYSARSFSQGHSADNT